MKFLLIFLGGGLGSVLRYGISSQTKNLWNCGAFPLGTFAVNIIGCLIMGIFISLLGKEHLDLKLLLITGFCGGFTTFSTFSSESLQLFQNGQTGVLALYVSASIILGILAIFLGNKFGNFI